MKTTVFAAAAALAAVAAFTPAATAVPHTWEIVGVNVTQYTSQKPGFVVEVEPALERRPVVLDDGDVEFYLPLLWIWTEQASVEPGDTFGSPFKMDISFRVDSSRILTVPFTGETWVRQSGIDGVQGGLLTSDAEHFVRHQGNVLQFGADTFHFNVGNLDSNQLSPGREHGTYVHAYLKQVSSSATPVPDVFGTAGLLAGALLCLAFAGAGRKQGHALAASGGT